MDNMTKVELKRESIKLPCGGAYQPSYLYNDCVLYKDTHTYSRNNKRIRPVAFLPRYGTSSSSDVRRHYSLKIGKHNDISKWRPYKGYAACELTMLGGWDGNESLGLLTTLTELSPLIQNKIRQEIMSGKAQLAVDLVELRKTKTMMADAGFALLQALRDLRAGRPFRQFAQAMRKEGFSGLAGRKWLEYIYGWAPTVNGAFETAEVLASSLQQGSICTGKVRTSLRRTKAAVHPDTSAASYEAYCRTVAKGYYQYTIRDPKLLRLSQLGFTNPLSIAWELTPWSFVLDWFVDVGGYINRMDYALGLSDIYWQYSCFQRAQVFLEYTRHPLNVPTVDFNIQKARILIDIRRHQRNIPDTVLVNTFRGIKPFTNETVRLTSAVALVNQQRLRLKTG